MNCDKGAMLHVWDFNVKTQNELLIKCLHQIREFNLMFIFNSLTNA